jgi:hypothetical protein
MRRNSVRAFLAVLATLALLIVSSSIALASIQSKTILTTNGLCVFSGDPPTLADGTTPCGAAVYGANGFTGTITYSADEIGTAASVVDFICTHTPGDNTFKSLAGTYALTVTTTGGAPLATASETVTGGQDCVDANNPVTSGAAAFTVPAGGVVKYSIVISGITAQNCPTLFAAFNAIRNGAKDLSDGSHANSPSVAPCGTPPFVPEAPFAALLVLTAGAIVVVYVARRSGFRFSAPRAA